MEYPYVRYVFAKKLQIFSVTCVAHPALDYLYIPALEAGVGAYVTIYILFRRSMSLQFLMCSCIGQVLFPIALSPKFLARVDGCSDRLPQLNLSRGEHCALLGPEFSIRHIIYLDTAIHIYLYLLFYI